MKGQFHDVIRVPEGADTAVLLLHGILSAPQFFAFLLPAVPQNYAVYGILLSGHGGDAAGLTHTTLNRWELQVSLLMKQLSAKYRRIFIAAHSMGTLFALRLAKQYPQNISGMLLLGVPLCTHLTPFGAVCSVLLALGYQPHTARGKAMQQAYSLTPDARLWRYLGWLPRYAELFDEIFRTRPLLSGLRVPCAAFQSARDELVSLRTLPMLAAVPAVKLRVLRTASHFYYPPQEKSRILRVWYRMLRYSGTAI
ncbi:MAG: alpha/beta fold hydrolase [Oscillospiraceae bacterium]|nr:alpha/beta fold hydrolase [Oscillospiraceae bacterium]